ncbi:MAG: DUF6048 family protein [Flavobacteriaceae bacterium]|nr:DUF6048 family protein [Flavobacteriaceae bacterium]
MLKYYINIFLILITPFNLMSQDDDISQDSIINQKYGLRIGFDLNKLINSYSDNNYEGIEFSADYRIFNKLYLASEIGHTNKYIEEDYINFRSKGNYLKVGIDYNLHNNWLDMQNMIFSGLRIGYSSFDQTINSYTIYDVNSDVWGLNTIDDSILNNNLSSVWLELIFGIKAEIFNNLFLGFNLEIKKMIDSKTKNEIDNLYVPGFNRTYEGSSFGTGFSYKISYLIPIIKK